MFTINIYLLAFLYIFYGLIMIFGILLLIFLPEDKISIIPILNNYISFAKDKTFAGHFYDYIMIVFCFYTICYGFSILQYFPTNIDNIFENKIFIYLLYFILGSVSLIFYSLVLYTNLPISKDLQNNTYIYKLYMLFGGSFILIPIIKEILVYIHPHLIYHVSEISQTTLIIGIFIIISIICELIYEYYINKIDSVPITTK